MRVPEQKSDAAKAAKAADASPQTGNPVSIFRGRPLPVAAHLIGYSALISRFDLRVPLHHELAAVSPGHIRRRGDGWVIHPIGLRGTDRVIEHLVFALKYEGVQLLTLKTIFVAFDKAELEQAVRARPTSAYLRRLCFFYEWLLQESLDVPDTVAGAYVEAIDRTQQYACTESTNAKRFRVRDNLPGSREFCPLVFKTHQIERFVDLNLSSRARAIVATAPKELIMRAAAFLLLSDSKASFAIEGENPPKDRIARWGAVVGKAGQIELTTDNLVQLQKELIGDDRFVTVGLRTEGGFIGRHDSFGQPDPEHISANAPDLGSLLSGLEEFNDRSRVRRFHPVLAATCIAFGFVYIHPFEDGNGRIHRFLMHHVLAAFGYTPPEIVFPISSVIYDDIPRYKDALEGFSRPLLDLVAWSPTEKGNFSVLTDTADYYRYFDATAQCEYLFGCVQRAVETNLPDELAFLEHRDGFHRSVTNLVDMGERKIDLLITFLRQGHGRLSNRAKSGEFAQLRPDEAAEIERLYAAFFSRAPSSASE